MEPEQIILPLNHVNSEHCATLIDKALGKITGITFHQVELNNERALIAGNDEVALIRDAVKVIRETRTKEKSNIL